MREESAHRPQRRDDLRAICCQVAAGAPVPVHVWQPAFARSALLRESRPHCTGVDFVVKPFDERVRIGVEIVETRRALRRLSASGGSTGGGSSGGDGAVAGSSGSKVAINWASSTLLQKAARCGNFRRV